MLSINLKPGQSVNVRLDENYTLIWSKTPKERPTWGMFFFTIICWAVVGFGLGLLAYDWIK